MLENAYQQIRTAFFLLIIFTLITGLIYPGIVTGIAQLFFPWQANGSMVEDKGKVIGSLLIGQSFTDPSYFWGRPSATTPFPYNAENSMGSNLGPSNPQLVALIKDRIAQLPPSNDLIPIDLVTASASGLDPEISPMTAFYQIPRIAKSRNIAETDLQELIGSLIKGRLFSFIGEQRINVLQLNIALDNLEHPRTN